ncbi:MAG: fused MFS/spermidine synthase [Candidatus Curtissbacteria bacterium]|nr:fused MFS/spermidine synthase [Candidatus Curtissbacteria bacterium]
MSFKLAYLLFFLSGVAGLIYEVVWSRLLVLVFGSTTNSIVAVISAFLGGLAIGSLISGKIADRLSFAKLIKTYSWLELFIGLSAGATLLIIPVIKNFYSVLSDGTQITPGILAVKFALTILVLIIPTTLMGATLPILARFLEGQYKSTTRSLSYLYAVNTLGGVVGVVLSAFILIELFGLVSTLLIGVLLNVLISALAGRIAARGLKTISRENLKSNFSALFSLNNVLVISLFGVSGLVSIAYEILWTRIFTPTLGTFIYAFASVLAIYLLGIALGSLVWDKFKTLVGGRNMAFAICELAIGLFALLTVILTSRYFGQMFGADENILYQAREAAFNRRQLIVLMIIPATLFMGLTFPAVVDLLDKKRLYGSTVGLAYFANTVGSICGGFFASFFIIPKIGSSQGVIFLAAINLVIAAIFIFKEQEARQYLKLSATLTLVVAVVLWGWLYSSRGNFYTSINQARIDWAKKNNVSWVFKEDQVASVLAFADTSGNHNLFIDGIPTTTKVRETKLMAHIPIFLHPDPKNILVIAFGMGSTFRSSLTHNIEADVVELVPSVPPLMSLFYPDADEVLKNPKGAVIINDGRNYVFLTREKYDVVTIDPPPPFNAAGTTLLYSREFYEDISKKLKEGGVVSQWVWFGSRDDDIAMVTKSFVEVFPYVLAIHAPESRGRGGMFLEGSFSPIVIDRDKIEKRLNENPRARMDLSESFSDFSISELEELVFANREDLVRWTQGVNAVSDQYPQTEYFILRHKFTKREDVFKNSIDSLFAKRESD